MFTGLTTLTRQADRPEDRPVLIGLIVGLIGGAALGVVVGLSSRAGQVTAARTAEARAGRRRDESRALRRPSLRCASSRRTSSTPG